MSVNRTVEGGGVAGGDVADGGEEIGRAGEGWRGEIQ